MRSRRLLLLCLATSIYALAYNRYFTDAYCNNPDSKTFAIFTGQCGECMKQSDDAGGGSQLISCARDLAINNGWLASATCSGAQDTAQGMVKGCQPQEGASYFLNGTVEPIMVPVVNDSYFALIIYPTSCDTAPVGAQYILKDTCIPNTGERIGIYNGSFVTHHATEIGITSTYCADAACSVNCVVHSDVYLTGCHVLGAGYYNLQLMANTSDAIGGTFNNVIYTIPFQPIWSFFAEIGLGIVIELILLCLFRCASKCGECCCGDSDKEGGCVKSAPEAANLLILFIRFILLFVTYILAAIKITSYRNMTGWQHYQLFVSLLSNSGVISAMMDPELVKKSFENIKQQNETGEDPEMSNLGACGVLFLSLRQCVALLLLLPLVLTHMVPGLTFYAILTCAVTCVMPCVYCFLRGLRKCLDKCCGFDAEDDIDKMISGMFITIYYQMITIPLTISMNYMVFFYAGVAWQDIFLLDFNLRSTGRFFNAEYFAPYQTVLNYANILL